MMEKSLIRSIVPVGWPEKIIRMGIIGDMVLRIRRQIPVCSGSNQFRLVIIDVRQRMVVGSVPLGVYPFGVATIAGTKTGVCSQCGLF